MRKPKILIVENALNITGGVTSILRSSEALKESFDFFFVLPTQSKVAPYLHQQGFKVYNLRMKELKKNIFTFVMYFPLLFFNTILFRKLIKKINADIIVSNDFYNLLPSLYKLMGGDIPYICYVRFLPSKFPKALVKFWCAWHSRYAIATVAVSNAVKKELPYTKNVVVVGNELPGEEALYISPLSSTLILYPANYIQGKGQEFALQSFAVIHKKYPQWKLKFVGGDMGLEKNKEFKRDLIQLAKSLSLERQVEWYDFSEKIAEEYMNAGIVLNFSESESFSMTCLEAMFYGRPVIATKSGGPSEIIDQNNTGILVAINGVKEMADAMDYLMSSPEKRETMGRRAYESVRQKFSYANTIGKLGKVYYAALKDHSI